MRLRRIFFLSSALAALMAGPALARNQCPAALSAAVKQQFPHTTLRSCRYENRVGNQKQYRVNLDSREDVNGAIYLNRAGKVVQVEKSISMESLPDLVYAAFQTQYRDHNIDGAKQQIDASGKLTYLIDFQKRGHKREATFTKDGRFLGES